MSTAPIIDDDDLLAPVVQRTELGLWIILASCLLLAFKDFSAVGVSRWIAALFKGVQIAAVIAGLAALRRPSLRHRTGFVSLTVFTVAVTVTAVFGVLSQDPETTPLLCIAITLASSAVLPWGAQRQLAAGLIAVAAILINHLFLGYVGYSTVAAIVAVAASVFIAQQLESQRDAEQHAAETLREREQFLRLIANGLPALIAYIDAGERCRFANRAFEDWFGLPRTLMNGKPLEEFIVPEAMAQLRPHVDAALEGRESSFEAIFTDRYGHDRIFVVTYVPDTTANGSVRGFFSMASDVTDRKQAEESVRQHQTQLAQALRLRTMGEMATALAQEVDQPLATIAELAARCLKAMPDAPEEIRRDLAQIEGEAVRAGEVVLRVETFARPAEPQWEPVNVNHAVEEAVRLVESEARHLGIGLRLYLAPTLPLVEADTIQVEQVVLNLLVNAFQAIEATRGGQRIVAIKTLQRSDGQIEVAVRDSGVGLPAGIAKRIFEPYFTTRADGLGMGLTISRSIVEAHGGRLWATSNPPSARGGATFRFSLPVGRPVANERAAS